MEDRRLICKTCKQSVESGTIYHKTEPNFHHAGCDDCGWYVSSASKIVLGFLAYAHSDLIEEDELVANDR
jgi:hypothetical protein